MEKMTKVFWGIIIFLVIAGSVGAAGYFYKQYSDIKKNPQKVSTDEVKSLISEIGKFMVLPTDEQPTLATVTDKEKLKDQDFFKNSENGDKILIYTKARKAILYRPSINKVIEVAPLLIGDGSQQVTPTSEPTKTKPITVTIYNGTKTVGFAGEMEKRLTGLTNLTIANKINATKNDYAQNLVIDISGSNKDKATEIAKAIGGTVTNLPAGENRPNTDILIIAAK